MKRVRAFTKGKSEFVKELDASDVNENTRYAYDYKCRDEHCPATFHWVRAYKRGGNVEEIDATFARDKTSAHKNACRHDFESIAFRHKDVAYIKGDFIHLRINFPMGAGPSDKFVRRGHLSRTYHQAAKPKPKYESFPSLSGLVKFVEREFGGLESSALDEVVLDYQGQAYSWGTTFVGAESYTQSFNDAVEAKKVPEHEQNRNLVIVKPLREIAPNQNGKPRFSCQSQYAQTGRNREHFQPVIVCHTPSTAEVMRKAVQEQQVLLIASKPFISSATLARSYKRSLSCSYSVFDHNQIASVSPEYFRYYPARQQTLDGFDL